jgi:methionyl-tRNA synthetase
MVRQQSAMWQAMLMAASNVDSRLRKTDKVFYDGFIGSGGKKMSKSTGNVIDPSEIIEKYGTDALRYFVVRYFNNHEDSDFTWKIFHENYNADLVNGLGNLTNRILAMSEKAGIKLKDEGRGYPIFGRENSLLEKYDFNGEAEEI